MVRHTRKDEVALWQMYVWSGVKAIAEAPNADGITILRTAQGNEYRFPLFMQNVLDQEQQLVNTLVPKNDTHILYLIHVWKNHWLDMPSHSLRSALLSLHPENKNTYIMCIGEENFVITSLEHTL